MWFVRKAGNVEAGPFPPIQLRRMAEKGELKETDEICLEGSDRWWPANKVKGIFVEAKSADQPPPLPVSAKPIGGDPLPTADAKTSAAPPEREMEKPKSQRNEEDDRPSRSSRSRDDHDRDNDRPRSRSRDGDDDDRRNARNDRDEREPSRSRDDDDRDDDRPRSRSRARGDDDDRATSRRTRDDDDDDRRRSRSRDDDDDDRDDRRRSRSRDSDDRKADEKQGSGFFGRMANKIRDTVDKVKGGSDDDRKRDKSRSAGPLKERSARAFRNSGEFDEDEFTRCWNSLEEIGINGAELVLFCPSLSRHDGGLGNKVAAFFTGKKTTKPIYHLAILHGELAVLYAPEEQPVQAFRFPLESLDWEFKLAAEMPKGLFAQAASLLRKPTDEEREKEEQIIVLTLKTGEVECILHFNRGKGADSARQAVAERLLARAESFFKEGRYVLCERFLERIPPSEPASPQAAQMRTQLALVGSVAVEYRQGHPTLAPGAKGLLRIDALGLEFYDAESGKSTRIGPTEFEQGSTLRKGQFPVEYTQRIQGEREAAQKQMAMAKAGFRAPNALLRMSARSSFQNARNRLLAARFGPPMTNRLVIRANIGGNALALVFDVAGADRETIESQAAAFCAQLASRGTLPDPSSRQAGARPVRSTAPQPVPNSRILGCPRCKARLRAGAVAFVQCPACQAKIRVPQSASGT